MAKKTIKKAKKAAPAKKVAKKQGVSAPAKKVVQGPLVPLHDRVIVRQLTEAEAGTQNAFGIIIPDTVSKEKPEQGIVVATGPGKWDEDGERRIPMSVEVGDKVVFSKYGYDEVKVAGEEYYIVSEGNILAIIK
jgi:chaperonin GroES